MQKQKFKRGSIQQDGIALGIAGIITQVLSFLYRIVLARMVSAEVLGIFQLVMPAYSVILSLTASGLTTAVSRQTATMQADGRRHSIRSLLNCSLGLFGFFFACIALIVVLFFDPISVHLLGDARTALGLLCLLPCLLLTGIENIHKHYFYGSGNVLPAAFIELLEMVVRIVSVLGLLFVFLPQNEERSVALIVCGMVLCELFSSVTLFLLARRNIEKRGFCGKPVEQRGLVREILSIAVPVGISGVVSNLMSAANSVLIPNRLVYSGRGVSEAISAYGVITSMTIPMLMLPTSLIGALNLILLPRLSESLAKGDCDGLNRRLSKAIKLTVLTMVPAMVLICLLGDDLGWLLFRQEEFAAQLVPMAVATLFLCLSTVLNAALNGLGKQKNAARISILCGAIQLVFTYTLVGIPALGLDGYAIGFCLCSILSALLLYRPARAVCRLRFRFFDWLVAPGLAALLMGLCVNLLHPILLSASVGAGAAVLFSFLFGILLYAVCLAAMGVHLLRE